MKLRRGNLYNRFLYNLNLPHFLFHLLRPYSTMTFGQKIIHKAKFDNRMLLTKFADKVEIKDRVAELIGFKYVVPNYKVVDDSRDLELSKYPREFVLKPSHASGAGFMIHEGAQRTTKPLSNNESTWIPYYEIHPDDLEINEEFIKEKSDGWLNSVYAPKKEYCYAAIPPKLIVEKYLKLSQGRIPQDFRFYTFKGKVKFFRVLSGISSTSAKFAYDEFGNPLEIKFKGETLEFQGHHPALPEQYKKMITFAEILASRVDFVRVDFYYVDDQI